MIHQDNIHNEIRSIDTADVDWSDRSINGCGWCIEACDYGAIMLHPESKVVYVCDLCKEKGEPQCIK